MSRMGAVALLCCLAGAGAGISGCTASAGSSSEAQTPVVIDIVIAGNIVTPNGQRVAVQVGQPVDLVVKAEEPGELHVHSRPDEQEFAFEPGTTTFTIDIDSPGVVEIEAHDLDKVIVQLEVR